MKIKIDKNFLIRIIIIIFSLFVAVFMYHNTKETDLYDSYFFVPLLYGVCLIFSFNLNFFNFRSPGLLVLNYTMFVKYSLMPLIMCLGNYYSWLGTMPSYVSIKFAVLLTIIEMVSLIVMVNYLGYKEKKELKIENQILPLKRISLHIVVIVLGILVFLAVPETFADHRLIFNTDNLATTIKVDFKYSGIFKTIFIFARYSLVLLIINFFYKRNKMKKSKINVLFAFIPVLLNCLYISNLSRISIFVPLLTFSIVIFLLFNEKSERRLIIRFLMIMMICSITFMSVLKFFGKGRGNENRSKDIGWWGDTLNMYFSGPKETAIGVEAKELIDNNYGWKKYKLFLNDILSNVIGLSNFVDTNNSNVLYNYTYFSSSIAICQICPNIIEGYYYFGILLCWIWPCLFAYLCFVFNKKAQSSKTLDLKFPYLYASIYCGMVLMINSAMIIANITNVSLLFIILSLINKRIKIKM